MISAELFGVALPNTPDSLKKIASFCLVETCHCEAVIESVLTGPKQLFLQSNQLHLLISRGVLTGIGLCAVKFRKLVPSHVVQIEKCIWSMVVIDLCLESSLMVLFIIGFQ